MYTLLLTVFVNYSMVNYNLLNGLSKEECINFMMNAIITSNHDISLNCVESVTVNPAFYNLPVWQDGK